jgi:hypothetical protein
MAPAERNEGIVSGDRVRVDARRRSGWDYAAFAVPWAIIALLVSFSGTGFPGPLIAGVAAGLTALGFVVMHLYRGVMGLAAGIALSFMGAVTLMLGPALILIALNAAL